MVIHKNTVQNNLAVLNAQENIIQRSDKDRNEQSKCIHYGDAHPENYRGCSIAKEI